MSSTRNKNSPGDYLLEQRGHNHIQSYLSCSSYGEPTNVYFAGDGLLMGRIPANHLSNNHCDIETQLFGIGSSNLVTPKQNAMPDIKSVKSLNIIDKTPVILPDPLVVEKNQRPQWM